MNEVLKEVEAYLKPLAERFGVVPHNAVLAIGICIAVMVLFLLLRRWLRPSKRSRRKNDESSLLEQCIAEQSLQLMRLKSEYREKINLLEKRLAAAEQRAVKAETERAKHRSATSRRS